MCFFKGTSSRPHKRERDGVSTYLALTFGTLLSSQGTEAAIGTVSPAPPGFPFVVFPTVPDSRTDS
ncbi:Stage II sporulation serine phosphatase for sigma-F activation (SpoIIE) [Actinacidiphila bryophytorum]|uniref:Stage II sporulation serine phosphatase for sigma-F activation (SpoIIE) n=1 Tax=Actinacidiphila bryophytorum TaxID=1436133 RepID=A0A9W4H073_9ACTN|nr:Stage II sporulation serine phosphatase for sigma-F activation (SpoIIE) [Actinacidiphila bryophytorum]